MAGEIADDGGALDIAKTLQLLSPIFLGSPTATQTTTVPGFAVANAQNVYNTATANANNPNATNTIVSNIMRVAAQNFAPTMGQQNNSGLYNSTTLQQLQAQSIADATAQSSQAVLNYQTQQEQIANSSSGDILRALSTRTSAAKPSIPLNITTGLTGALGGYSLFKKLAANTDNIKSFVTDPITSIKNAFSGAESSSPYPPISPIDLQSAQIQSEFANSPFAISGGGGGITQAGGVGTGIAPELDAVSISGGATGVGDTTAGITLANAATDAEGVGAATLDVASSITSDAGAAGLGTGAADSGIAGLSAADIGGAGADIAGGAAVAEGGADLFAAGGAAALGTGAADAGVAGIGAATASGGFFSTVGSLAAAAAASWIICTELVSQGKMNRRHYIYGARVFAKYWEYGKRGYYLWAIPSVRHLRRNPASIYSKALGVVFRARAEYLAAMQGCPGARRTVLGWVVAKSLWYVCAGLAVTICPFLPARFWNPYEAGYLSEDGTLYG